MRGFSKVVLCGNLTKDPELRTTPSGTQVCSFGIAVNRVFRDASGADNEKVSFFDCTAWGKQGETLARYMKKGNPLLVSGRLDQHSWDDKTTGAKRSRVEIIVEDFTFIGGGDGSNAGGRANNVTGSAAKANEGAGNVADVVPDDIPVDGEVSLDDMPF